MLSMLAYAASQTDTLADAVSGLAAETVGDLSDHAMGDDLVAIRRQIDRLEAEFIRRLHRFDRSRAALAEGAVSTVSWVRGRCGLSGAAAAERVRMARVLDELPQTTESFRAGRASFGNVALIARLADDVGTEATQTVEDTLVGAAEKLDVARMGRLVAFTRYRLDADGALERDVRGHEHRWFSCDQTFGGVFVLRGELDAEGGALVKTAIDALSAAAGPSDERKGGQRRADALVDLASRQLQGGDLPTAHGQRPHLTMTVSLDTLQRRDGAAPAELGGAGPVHPETARRIACDAVRTIAVVAHEDGGLAVAGDGGDAGAGAAAAAAGAGAGAGAGVAASAGAGAGAGPGVAAGAGANATASTTLSVGRATRTIPAPIRTALALRDKGCRFPGCDRPPRWTDGHHIQHWADQGETELPNLVSLCRRHHHMVHERGWSIRLERDGNVAVAEPMWSPGGGATAVAVTIAGRLRSGVGGAARRGPPA